jgi:hypothetical protein
MSKCRLVVATALILVASHAANAASGFTLLSRSLIEGPARVVCFFDRGVILGTGTGIAVFTGLDALGEPALLPLEGQPYEICTKGTVAYVAAFGAGLIVVDLSDPLRPVEIFSYQARLATRCAVGGDFLYLADDRHLLVFDISNPRAPVFKEMKTVSQNENLRSLVAEGDLVCVATKPRCTVYRAAPRDTLEVVADLQPQLGFQKVGLRNGVLFFLSRRDRLGWRSLLTRERPLAGELREPKDIIDFGFTESGGMLLTENLDIVPFTTTSISTTEGTSPMMTVTTGKRITGLGLRSHALTGQPGDAPVLAMDQAFSPSRPGDRVAFVWPRGGLILFALEGRRARRIGSFETSGFAFNLVASRDVLYVANGRDGVRIGRVKRDGAVDWIGHLRLEDARDVALSGGNLVVANGGRGLIVADVSDPGNPGIVGEYRPNNLLAALRRDVFSRGERNAEPYLSDVAVRGNTAYCAGGFAGVVSFDLSDPQNPRLAWRQKLSEVRGVDVDDRYLYVADGYEGMRIFSLEGDPPSPISVLKTGAWTCGCSIVENTAYIADGGRGVYIADVTDRGHPLRLSSTPLGAIVRDLFPLHDVLFVANERGGVVAIGVSDPRAPAIVARSATVDDARGVFADGDFVYVASGEGGVYIFSYVK